MTRASRPHKNNRRFSPSTIGRPLLAVAIAALALSVLAGAGPLRAAPRQGQSSSQGAKSENNPKRAKLDVSVGKFYMNRGDYDAAISRLRGAVRHDPRWSVPYRYLGQCYEKKRDPKHALAAYREYLKIKPYAKDARKIKKRIRKLEREIRQRNAANR
jgi:Tfp pilus assembly protein PilF